MKQAKIRSQFHFAGVVLAALISLTAFLSCTPRTVGPTSPKVVLSKYTWASNTWHNGPTQVSFVRVSIEDGSSKKFSFSNSKSWLTVSAASDMTPDSIALSPNSFNLPIGTHIDTVRVSVTGVSNSPALVVVQLTIGPAITLSTGNLKFTGTKLLDGKVTQPVSVVEGGDSTIAVTASVAGSPGWLTADLLPATTPSVCSVSVFFNNPDIPAGISTREISISSAGVQNSPQKILCSLLVKAWRPQTISSVLNYGDIQLATDSIGYVVGHTSSGPSGSAGFVYKTTDAGTDWNDVVLFRNYRISAIDFLDSDIGWAVGDSGNVLKTITGGASWDEQSIDSLDIYDVDFSSADTGFCVGEGGLIYHSTDGGASWAKQTSGVSISVNAVEAHGPMIGYACAASGRFLRTINGGTTWNTIIVDGVGTSEMRSLSFTSSANGWLADNSGQLWSTNDSGQTWQMRSKLSTTSLLRVFFVNSSFGWALGSNGKVFGTVDGGANWSQQYLPDNTGTTFFGFSARNESNAWLCGTSGTVLFSPSGGR